MLRPLEIIRYCLLVTIYLFDSDVMHTHQLTIIIYHFHYFVSKRFKLYMVGYVKQRSGAKY